MRIFLKNIFLLLIRIFSILIIYQLCRLLYFFYNINYFANINFVSYLKIIQGSIKFDISAVFYINSLVILFSLIPSNLIVKNWYKKFISFLFISCNFLGILVNIIDVFYYPFAKNRFTISFINEFSNEKSPLAFIIKFVLDYWYAVLLIPIVIFLLKHISKITTLKYNKIQITIPHFFIALTLAFSLLTLTVYGLRGSFIYKNRPITISNAGKYAKNPNEISLIINTPFSLIRTATIQDLDPKNFFSDEQLEKIYPVIKQYDSNKKPKKNVVIIILESMATEYYGVFNNYEGYTPFLDSLISQSYTSYNTFANGKKSIDAIPSILASIPAVKFHFTLSKYCTNNIQGIGNILQEQGYYTSFFHGAPNGSMGFESISTLCGMDHYYGMDDYGNNDDFDGLWGIWDHKFLNYYANQLNKMPEPFCSSIMTCSSHHPYIIPKEFKNKFKKGTWPMHECVQYTDYSLKLFFDSIKNNSWYNNTLFIITADHTNYAANKLYNTSTGIFRVPIIFFDPSNQDLKGISKKIVQHIDIMPSILGYIKYPEKYISFGSNVFANNEQDSYAINYHNGFQLISPNTLVQYNEQENKITGVFDFKKDTLLKNNIKNQSDSIAILENKIKGFIQQYNNRMIENNLIVK